MLNVKQVRLNICQCYQPVYIAFDDLQRSPGSYICWKLFHVNEHFCYKLLILLRECLSWLLIVVMPILFAPSLLQTSY